MASNGPPANPLASPPHEGWTRDECGSSSWKSASINFKSSRMRSLTSPALATILAPTNPRRAKISVSHPCAFFPAQRRRFVILSEAFFSGAEGPAFDFAFVFVVAFVRHPLSTNRGCPRPLAFGDLGYHEPHRHCLSSHNQKQRDRAREGPVSSRNHACKSGAFREDVRHLNAESGRQVVLVFPAPERGRPPGRQSMDPRRPHTLTPSSTSTA